MKNECRTYPSLGKRLRNLVIFIVVVTALIQVPGRCFAGKTTEYIVLKNGDTVKCKILSQTVFSDKYDNCTAKKYMQMDVCVRNSDGKVVTYSPKDVSCFISILNADTISYKSIYVPALLGDKYPAANTYFARQVAKGKINIYSIFVAPATCIIDHTYSRYAFFLQKESDSVIAVNTDVCSEHPDYNTLTNYLGKGHEVLQECGDTFSINKLLYIVSKFNSGKPIDLVRGTNIFKTDSQCHVLLVQKKNTKFRLRSNMDAYAERGFYLYKDYAYTLKFKDNDFFQGVIQKITQDSIYVSSSLNEDVARKDDKPYSILTFPISSLEKIHRGMYGTWAGKNIHIPDYTVTYITTTQCPKGIFDINTHGVIKTLYSYFAGDVLLMQVIQGVVYWYDGT